KVAPAEGEGERAGAGTGGEPAGEAAGGASGPGEVEQGGAAAGPVTGRRGMGAGNGAERGVGGEPAGEGAGVPGTAADRRQSDASVGDQPLATRPAPEFGPAESPWVDKAGNIRLENLTDVEDVRQAIREAAGRNNDFIGDRRGIVTDGQVMDLANDIGMSGAWDLVHQHVTGQAFNAEQVVALRKLVRETAADVAAAAKRMAVENTPESAVAFAQAEARLDLVAGTVSGATAEAGRALRSFRDIKGDLADADRVLREATGRTLFQTMARAKLASTLDTPGKLAKFARDGKQRSIGSMLLEYWVNALISGPITHATYLVGNAALTTERVLLIGPVASAIGRLHNAMGREGPTVPFGEVGAAL